MSAEVVALPPVGFTEDLLIESFATWLRSWGASENTITVRAKVARMFAVDHDVYGVDRASVQGWLGTPGWAPQTRSTYFGHLRSLFGWMCETGRRGDDPTTGLRRPRVPIGLPRPLSDAEADLVLSAATEPVRTYLLLALYAGLRAHEVGKIRGEDVTGESIFVVGKGGRPAALPTHPLIWEAAHTYPRTGWWFPTWSSGGHVTQSGVTGAVTRLFTSLSIEGSLHRCRHSYGTDLLRSGANIRVVQELMRHSSLATTQRYTAVSEQERHLAIVGLRTR